MQAIVAKISKISDRFSKMLEFLELRPAQFAKHLGYERAQTVYDIKNGTTNPSADFFMRFINAGYSERINIEWLIAGKGDMKATMPETQESDTSVRPDILIQYLREKDDDIKNMAEEIGRLKTIIENFKKENYKPGPGRIDQAAEPDP